MGRNFFPGNLRGVLTPLTPPPLGSATAEHYVLNIMYRTSWFLMTALDILRIGLSSGDGAVHLLLGSGDHITYLFTVHPL